jgi:ketosteroid isomerase-like protein
MKMRLVALGVVICVALVASGRPHARMSTANVNSVSMMSTGMISANMISTNMISTNMGEDDFRKLEQAWLDAASVPDLPALRKMFSDDFMGTSFGAGVLGKNDVVPPSGSTAPHMPKCVLKDSTVKIFGETAVLMGEVEMQVPQKSEAMRMTTVFQKHGEDWQVIAVHMSKASEGQS